MDRNEFASMLLSLFNEFSRAKLEYHHNKVDSAPVLHFENPDNFAGFIVWLTYREIRNAQAQELREG